MVLKGLIFNIFHFGSVVCLKGMVWDIFQFWEDVMVLKGPHSVNFCFGRVWWSCKD